jgi:hypothetical protein
MPHVRVARNRSLATASMLKNENRCVGGRVPGRGGASLAFASPALGTASGSSAACAELIRAPFAAMVLAKV